MRSANHLVTVVVGFAGIAQAANSSSYTLQDAYNTTNFFQSFDFFNGPDPTSGFVNYVSASAANTTGLAGFSNNAVLLGVDHKTLNPPAPGRASTRVTSKKAYNSGLFIADIAHMPGGCGVWPAFWTVGKNWPADGEIDIIEGVNADTTNAVTLHTSAGCNMASTGALSTSSLSTSNCNANTAFDGCSFSTASTQGFGAGFNANQGGVYAMEWTSSAISVWFFARSTIPADITSGKPSPPTWGTPTALFAGKGGCDIASHFQNHQIVFDTTFCGQWAGKVWSSGSCASLAPTCDAYVAQNPSAFATTYWLINSVKVYQQPGVKRDLAQRFKA